MDSLTTIQIMLYTLTGISSVIALFNSFKNDDLKRWIKIITMILIFITLVLSIVHENLKRDEEKNASEKREQDHRQYIDSLSKIIVKSDSALQTQSIIQKRTDSLLIKSNEISEETQNVLSNTVDVLKYQEKTLLDEDRKRDPLFPMDLEITIKLRLDHEIFKEVIDTFLYYKKIAEAGMPYDKRKIQVNWLGNKEKISNIIFSNCESFFKHDVESYNRIQFILNRNFHFRLYSSFNGNVEQLVKSTPIFNAITDRKFGAVQDIFRIEVDYDNQIVYFISRFKKIIFVNPLPKNSIGVSDLFNHYLVIYPSGLCNCELMNIRMEIGKTNYKSLVYLEINNSNVFSWGQSGNCKIFVRKINQNEITRPVQPSD